MPLTDDEVFGAVAPAAPRASGGGMSDEEVFGKAAAPTGMDAKPGGFTEEFKKAFRGGSLEGVWGLLKESMPVNLWKAGTGKDAITSRKQIEAAALLRANQIVKDQQSWPAEAVKKAYELLGADAAKKKREADEGVLDPAREMVAGALENPGQATAELANSLIRDPWQVAPVAGQIGRGATWGSRVAGVAGAGAATNAAIEAAAGGAKGEADPMKIAGAAVAGGAIGAPFALLGKGPARVAAETKERALGAKKAAENDTIMDMAERFADARPPAEPPGFIPPKDLSKMKPKERAAYDKARAAFDERFAADQEAAASYDPEAMQADIEASLMRYFDDAQGAIPEEPKAAPPKYNTPEAPDVELPFGNMAGLVPKGRLADTPIVGETPPVPTPADPHITLFESARDKMVAGRAWDLTAEEKVALRGHVDSVTRGGVIDPQTSRARQHGEVDPRLLGLLASGALGAAVLGTDFADEDAKKYIAAGIAGSMGLVGKGGRFYHAMPEVLGKVPRKAGTAAEWAKEIEAGAGKVGKGTAEEWREMGGPEWLAAREGKVTKADIADFIEKGGVRVEERELGATPEQRAFDEYVARTENEPVDDAAFARYTELENAARESSAPPQYDVPDLRLPGEFTNYREHLTKLPDQQADRAAAIDREIGEIEASEHTRPLTAAEEQRLMQLQAELATIPPDRQPAFTQSHHPDANIVAHDRTTDRVAADGTPGTLIEEIQSDWGQKGRQKGFTREPSPEDLKQADSLEKMRADLLEERRPLKAEVDEILEKLNPFGNVSPIRLSEIYQRTGPGEHFKDTVAAELEYYATDAQLKKLEAYAAKSTRIGELAKKAKELRSTQTGVLKGPFVTSTEGWASLQFRSALARAVGEGKRWLAWTTGEQQNARYNLRTHVDELRWDGYSLVGRKDGAQVLQENILGSSLPEYVGEALAKKLERDGTVRGPDLEVGQKDLRPFYDKILRGIAEKVSKKLGGEGVVEIEIGPKQSKVYTLQQKDGYGFVEHPETTEPVITEFPTREAAIDHARFDLGLDNYRVVESPGIEPMRQPGIRITPALAANVSKGMPLHARQGGFIDPKLSAALGLGAAGAAVGAWIGGQDKAGRGAIIGALTGIAAALGALRKPGAAINWGLGLVSREFNQLDPRLRRVMTHFERESLEQNLRDHVKAAPFVETFKGMKAADQAEVALALSKGTVEARAEISAKYPKLALALDAADALIKEKSDWLRNERRFKNGPEYYWHRQVKDLDGLLGALGKDSADGLAAELMKLETRVKEQAGRLPTEMERAEIVADWMRRTKAGLSQRAGYSNKRVVDMTPELLQFYHDPATALLSFLAEANKDIGRTKLFGKNAINKSQDGVKYLNIEASIGKVVERQMAEGRLSPEQASKLRELLRSRLGPGEQSMPGWHQDIQNVVTASLLGHVTNAVKQVPDFAMGTLLVGLRPTLSAVMDGLRGKSKMQLKDLGLINNIMDEFTQTRASAKYLTYVLNKSGFSAIDVGARHTIVNAALAKYTRDAVSGGKALARKYEKSFTPDEMDQLKMDLIAGEKTPLVRDLVFMELSDIQPISRLEKPQAYLDHPSGRFMYHLKSYTLKQLDIARREVLDNWKAGRKAEALGKAAGLAVVWGLIGAATDTFVDFLLGQKTKLEDKIIDTMARNLGWSDWTATQLKGKPGQSGNAAAAAGTLLAPPAAGVIYDVATMRPQAVRHIPLIGRLLYAYAMGGAMEAQERELIKNGGLPQVKEQREAREETGNATALDKERLRMQKQKLDDQEKRARQSGQEDKADKLLERSEKLRGRLEKMSLSDAKGTAAPKPWMPYAEKLDQNARPWTPPAGFFPEDRGNRLRGPRVYDDQGRAERVRQLQKVM